MRWPGRELICYCMPKKKKKKKSKSIVSWTKTSNSTQFNGTSKASHCRNVTLPPKYYPKPLSFLRNIRKSEIKTEKRNFFLRAQDDKKKSFVKRSAFANIKISILFRKFVHQQQKKSWTCLFEISFSFIALRRSSKLDETENISNFFFTIAINKIVYASQRNGKLAHFRNFLWFHTCTAGT